MALAVDWGPRNILVSRADMTLIQSTPEIRELDLDLFRKDLNGLQAAQAGIWALTTHKHNTTVGLAGFTLARVVEIINQYFVTFEDGQYAVNLVGGNSNVADVAFVNQVSIRSANSSGLVQVIRASDFDSIDRNNLELARDHARASNQQTKQ